MNRLLVVVAFAALCACGRANYHITGTLPDNDASRWRAYITSHHMPWTNVPGVVVDKQSDAAERYGIESVPANFLISPDGLITARNLTPEALLSLAAGI